MAFATKQQLIDWLKSSGYKQTSTGDWFPSGTYYLSHGEYSQPDYTPRRYKDGWSLHAIYYYHPRTFNAPLDGRVDDRMFEYAY